MLLDTLRSYKPNTGIIYYSWFESHNENDNNYLFDHIQEIITNFIPSPLFLLSPEDLSNNTYAGGYYVSTESFCDALLETLEHVLKGEQARNIPGRVGGEGKAYLCYPVLKSYNIPSFRYPKDAVYINEPKTFFQQYRVEILSGFIILFILVAAITYYIRILRKAYSRLHEAMEKAEQANQLKSAFLANMSHEIRTPLNAIVGFSSILADAEEPEEKEEYINIIENNNTLLLQLVGDILDLSKIESGTLEFVYSDIDLNALFQELEESARLRQKNDAVVIRYLPEMPDCFVNIEKNRLTQVVTNMMNNAMKFTPSGSITFGYHLKNTDFLYFYITDTGYGIEKDKKDTVFGRFVKLDSFSQGTGLGLSICQSIVENLGGEIGVESEPGKGSTFWFTLPYRPVELKSVREQKEHRLNKVESKLTVLIAEDNESNFLLFESILKRQYNILHAWDGEEAVELFKQYNPHLILMDINMPKKTGYEATQLIREMSPTVPIMAVTAYVYAEDEERILNSGFDAYTSKPINAQKLQSDIVDLLKKQLIFM